MKRRLQDGVTSRSPRILVLSVVAALAGTACSADTGPAEPQPAGAPSTTAGTAGVAEADRIQAYIYANYAPSDVRHSFRTVMGDDIDCIDFYAQPSVKAALQHGIQVSDQGPPTPPPDLTPATGAPPAVAFNGDLDESGHARACPTGSVPYVRRSVDRIQRAGGLDALLARTVKPHAPPPSPPGPASPGAADYGCYNTNWGQSNASSGSPCAWTSLNSQYAPNMALSPTGTWQTPGVAPPEVTLITYNPGNGYWYVAVNGSWIGYFSLPYTGQMLTSAAVFQVGGEIYEASEDPTYDNNKPSDDQTCMGACYNPANSTANSPLGYKVSAYAYDNYYLLKGSGSQMCSGAPCCSNGLCWTPANDTPTVTKGSESGLGVASVRSRAVRKLGRA